MFERGREGEGGGGGGGVSHMLLHVVVQVHLCIFVTCHVLILMCSPLAMCELTCVLPARLLAMLMRIIIYCSGVYSMVTFTQCSLLLRTYLHT